MTTLSIVAMISLLCSTVTTSYAFVTHSSCLDHRVALPPLSCSVVLRLAASDENSGDSDPDLFEYFDPLLSPHAYPSGVSPAQKPAVESNDEVQEERRRGVMGNEGGSSKSSFGFRLSTTETTSTDRPVSSGTSKGVFGFDVDGSFNSDTNPPSPDETKEEDLLEYFDPLRSPHEYPNGIDSKKQSMESMTATPPSLQIVEGESSGNSKKRIGVLLMDHGSKKPKSNARLQEMARLYQLTLGYDDDENEGDSSSPTIIVRAAHMEIATPSIADGLKDLKDLGVDEIICHPFFLSADGRHVKEDIPRIIETAIEELWGNTKSIPIVTTPPVGSNTQLMLGAIHSLVRENSQYLRTSMQTES